MPSMPTFLPDGNRHEGMCSGDWTLGMVSDQVVVPTTIKPGKYVEVKRANAKDDDRAFSGGAIDAHVRTSTKPRMQNVCMDCGKRFEGEAYKEHLSCVSEAEKYQGKLFQAKENKGEVKQRSWIEGVQQRLESTPGVPHAPSPPCRRALAASPMRPRRLAVRARLSAGFGGAGGSQLRQYAERLLAYENLPRKKAKFVNFAKNSLNLKARRRLTRRTRAGRRW